MLSWVVYRKFLRRSFPNDYEMFRYSTHVFHAHWRFSSLSHCSRNVFQQQISETMVTSIWSNCTAHKITWLNVSAGFVWKGPCKIRYVRYIAKQTKKGKERIRVIAIYKFSNAYDNRYRKQQCFMMKHKDKSLSCFRRLVVYLQNRLQLRAQLPGMSIRPHVANRLSN